MEKQGKAGRWMEGAGGGDYSVKINAYFRT